MQAMEAAVESVWLGGYGGVSLDITEMMCWPDTGDNYHHELWSWARSIQWEFTIEEETKHYIFKKSGEVRRKEKSNEDDDDMDQDDDYHIIVRIEEVIHIIKRGWESVGNKINSKFFKLEASLFRVSSGKKLRILDTARSEIKSVDISFLFFLTF